MSRPMPYRRGLVAMILLLTLAPAAARADLAADVEAALRADGLAGAVSGVSVVALGDAASDDEAIYDRLADRPLVPASNLKLVTAAAALDALGGDFTFRTVLAHDGTDLALVGDGDPATGDAELLRPLGWEADTLFARWADALKARGVTAVGDVRVDDSVFDERPLHPDWPANQMNKSYVPQVAGVNFNANLFDIRLSADAPGGAVAWRTEPPTAYFRLAVNEVVAGGPSAAYAMRRPGTNHVGLHGRVPAAAGPVLIQVTAHDPPRYAGTVLAEALGRAGVEVNGTVRRDDTIRRAMLDGDGDWKVVGVLETSMGTVLSRLNKDSMNLYAEALCKRMGHAATGEPGSWASGTAAMGRYLNGLGVPSAEFALADGSGLSRKNTVSASALTAVLAGAYHSDDADAFFDSLSVAGADGTLEGRFAGPAVRGLRGRVFGKSGFINHVSSLSGYLRGPDGRWYAFAILMNDVPLNATGRAKAAQERIVLAVDRHAEARATTPDAVPAVRVGG